MGRFFDLYIMDIKRSSRLRSFFTPFCYYIILSIFIFAVTRIGLDDLYNMRFLGVDFSFYDSAIWGGSQGTFLHSSILNIPSYLGIHFSPILFIFVPLYVLGAGPWVLILARTTAAAGGSLLIRKYALKYTKIPAWGADIASISFLLHPMLHMASLSEFHGAILDLFFIPLFFVAIASRKKWFIWVALVFLLSVREDTWVYATGMALLLLWKDDRKLALQIALTSAVWGILALTIWMPWFQSGCRGEFHNIMFSGYLSRYHGYTLSKLVSFLQKRLRVDFDLLLPIIFLPLLSGRYLILLLLPLIQIQSGCIVYQRDLLLHYSAPILPCVYIAGVRGWERIDSILSRRFGRTSFGNGVIGVLILFFSFFMLKTSIIVRKKYPALFRPRLIQLREKTAFKLLEEIPKSSSLSLQPSLFLIGSHRKRTYIFSGYPPLSHYPSLKTDYVMIDLGRPFVEARGYKRAIADLLKKGEYGVLTYKDGFIVMKRGWPPIKNLDVLWKMKYRIQGESAIHHQSGTIEEGVEFDWKAARVAKQGRDKEGAIALSVRRILPRGNYKVNFSMFLAGKKGMDAVGFVLKKVVKGNRRILLKKVVKFQGDTLTKTLFSYEFSIYEATTIETAIFYGGRGIVTLDYFEFVNSGR